MGMSSYPLEHDSRKGGTPQSLIRHQPLQLLEEVLNEDDIASDVAAHET